jgi:hypothetical protein
VSNYLTQPLRDAYWVIVKECLTRFYDLGPREADARVAALHRDMEDAPADIDTDVVYTNQAFDLAGELAGRELDIRSYRDEYLAMMDRIYGEFVDHANVSSPPPRVLPELRAAYWALVRECMVRFHGLTERQAARRVAVFIRHLEQAPPELNMDIVFNNEAFDLASDLAERELDRRLFWDEYMEMMDRIYAAYLNQVDACNPPPGVLPAA